MKTKNVFRLFAVFFMALTVVLFSSCDKDPEPEPTPDPKPVFEGFELKPYTMPAPTIKTEAGLVQFDYSFSAVGTLKFDIEQSNRDTTVTRDYAVKVEFSDGEEAEEAVAFDEDETLSSPVYSVKSKSDVTDAAKSIITRMQNVEFSFNDGKLVVPMSLSGDSTWITVGTEKTGISLGNPTVSFVSSSELLLDETFDGIKKMKVFEVTLNFEFTHRDSKQDFTVKQTIKRVEEIVKPNRYGILVEKTMQLSKAFELPSARGYWETIVPVFYEDGIFFVIDEDVHNGIFFPYEDLITPTSDITLIQLPISIGGDCIPVQITLKDNRWRFLSILKTNAGQEWASYDVNPVLETDIVLENTEMLKFQYTSYRGIRSFYIGARPN